MVKNKSTVIIGHGFLLLIHLAPSTIGYPFQNVSLSTDLAEKPSLNDEGLYDFKQNEVRICDSGIYTIVSTQRSETRNP